MSEKRGDSKVYCSECSWLEGTAYDLKKCVCKKEAIMKTTETWYMKTSYIGGYKKRPCEKNANNDCPSFEPLNS